VERRLDGGILAIRLVPSEDRPSARAAGDEATKQHDECDGDELDAEAR
jgi:hypothetical protein